MYQGRKMSLLMPYHGDRIWLLRSWRTKRRGQPYYSGYVKLSSGLLEKSGMLQRNLHALEKSCLSYVVVWYAISVVVTRSHL